jgi:uncharacterized membrane protein
MRTWLSLAALSAILFTGCTKSPEGGTPGTKGSFKIVGPATSESIKQGNQDTVKLSLDRGSDFKKDVKLSVNAPDKLKAELSKSVIKASEGTDFTLTISADKEAAIGDHIVKVTGTPEGGGESATLDVKVKVSENK